MKAKKVFSLLLLVLNVSAFVNASEIGKKVGASAPVTTEAKQAVVVSVDVDKIVEKAEEFISKRKEVEEKLKVHAKPLEDLQKKVQEKQAAIEKNNTKLATGAKDMNEAAKKAVQDENNGHQTEIMKASQEHQVKAQEFQGKAETARQEFIKFVQDRIKQVARKLGIDIVVFPGVSLVVNESFDHTHKILEALNAEHEKKHEAKKSAMASAAKPAQPTKPAGK